MRPDGYRSTAFKFSAQEQDTLRNIRRDHPDWSCPQVADKMRRPKSTVYLAARRLNVPFPNPRPPIPREEIDMIVKACEAGETVVRTSKALGKPQNLIRAYLQRINNKRLAQGLPYLAFAYVRPHAGEDLDFEGVLADLHNGMTVAAVATKYNRTPSRITQRVRRYERENKKEVALPQPDLRSAKWQALEGELIRRWDAGETIPEIAAAMSTPDEPITESAVRGQLMRCDAWRHENGFTTTAERLDALANLAPGRRQCHWALGHVGEDGFHYCKNEKSETGPYCRGHDRMAHNLDYVSPMFHSKLERETYVHA